MTEAQRMQPFYHHSKNAPGQPFICRETGKPFTHCRIETDSNGEPIRSVCEHCETTDFPVELPPGG